MGTTDPWVGVAALVGLIVTTGLTGCGGGGGEPAGSVAFDANITPPVTESVSVATVEGTAVSGQVVGHDPDGNEVRFFLSRPPIHGIVTGLPPGPSPVLTGSLRGEFTYTPAAGFVGSDSFGFVANDGDWNSSEGRVSIRVSPRGMILAAAAMTMETAALSTGGWLPVVHDMPGAGNRLYALDRSNVSSPVLVAEADARARISGAGWFGAAQVIFFRRDGALFFWAPRMPGPAVSIAPSAPGGLLGDIALAPDGERLAFVAAAPGSRHGHVYVLDRRLGVQRVLPPDGINDAAWPVNLAFDAAGTELRFDLDGAVGPGDCRIVFTVGLDSHDRVALAATIDRRARCAR